MTRHESNPTPHRPFASPRATLPVAVLAVAVVSFAAPAAAEKERGMPAQASGTSVSAPAPAPAPAPVSAPARSSAPSSQPSYQPAPARSAPASSPPSSSPSTASAPARGSSGSGSASGAARIGGGSGGYVSAPPRGSFHPKPYPPNRHYHPPAYWGTWYGNPYWGWGWGPYWGWGWGWGWGGVVVVNDDGPYDRWYARVDTDVSPETAEVYLDGTYIGSADDFDGFPDYLYLEPGRYKIEFRHPTYETVSKEVEAREGRGFRFEDEMKLLPLKKRLDVVDPEDRGTPLGRVFGKPEAAESARTGRHQVRAEEVELDELEDVDEPEEVEDEDVVEAPAAPEADEDVVPAERGRLRFEVEPADAAVYLDDRYIGTGEELAGLDRGLPVTPGKHTVTVVRPGRTTRSVEVEAKPGVARDVVVRLEK